MVFTLNKKLRICARISNQPWDTIGCWYGNKYVISSEFKWLAHMISTSRLWTNKVDLAEGDQNDYTLSCMRPLFNFYNRSGNAIRHMLIAECPMALAPTRVTGSPAENSCTGTKRLLMQSIR